MRVLLALLAFAACGTVRMLPAQELPLDSLLRTPVNAAAKYAQTVSEAAASVTIITAEEIRRYGYRTLDEILTRVPGFYSTYDRNYSSLGVRGFSRPGDYNNRVLLLLDGHTMNEGVFGSASVGTDLALDPDHIERVEVVLGPGSALYGTGAMLTSINIVTVAGHGLDGLRVSAGAGSLGERHVAAAFGGRVGRDLQATIAGQWSDTDGEDQYYAEYDAPATNNGIAHNLDWDRHHSVLLGLRAGGWAMSAFAGTRSKAFPTGAYLVEFNDSRARTLDERQFVELRYGTAAHAATQLDVRGYVGHYGYEGTYPYTLVSYDEASDDEVGAEARLRWDTGSRNRILVGVEYRRHVTAHYRFWDADSVYQEGNVPFGVFSLYAQDELQLTHNLSLVLGLRHDAQSASVSSTSPRLAVLYHPAPGTSIKLLYGEAFRSPSMYERLNQDPAGLRPERIRTLEAVLEQRLGGSWFATLAGYRFRMRDLIDTIDSALLFGNISLATSTGGSLALNGRFHGGSSAYLSYGYKVARDGNTGLELTNSPRHVFKGGAATPFGRHLLVSGEAQYQSGRGTVYGTTTDGFLWTGMHLVVSPGSAAGRTGGSLLQRTEFSVTVANLLDARYSTPGGFEHIQPQLQQDGRTARAGVRIWW